MSNVVLYQLRALVRFVLGCCFVLTPHVVESATTPSVTLSWDPNSEADLAGYNFYQGTTSGSYGPSVDIGNITTHTASNLQAGLTYYFAVTAYDFSGNESLPSGEVSKSIADVAQDVTPPSITLTSPSDGTIVSAPVTITATATDNVGVVGVQFQLNSSNLGPEDTSNTFSAQWDPNGMSPGQYALTGIARDAAGNTTSSVPVLVTVTSSSPLATLSVSILGSGTVTSSPTGILCTQGTCSAAYGVGSTVTLIAKADKKWKFAGWTGACSGTGECVLQLSTDQVVGATFSQNGNRAGREGGPKK